MKTTLNLFFLSLLLFCSCTEKTSTQETVQQSIDSVVVEKTVQVKFPKVISVDSLKQTDFVFALEQKIKSNKNIIYAPTVLLAWDELKKAYNTSTFFPATKDPLFSLLNDTKSHLTALDSNEYEVEIKKSENEVEVRTYFKKSLPFELDMQAFDDFAFKKDSVKSFGFEYQDWDILKNILIVYYKNDQEFIIKLLPKDKSNEIILVKGDRTSHNFKEALAYYKSKSELGVADYANEKTRWKRGFMPGDVMRIPTLSFNIEKFYEDLMGAAYTDDQKLPHKLKVLYQRNAFVLNESGAKMESEAVVVDTAAAIGEEVELPKPKNLFFNDDFYVFVKKKNSESPYFALKITNAELMERLKSKK